MARFVADLGLMYLVLALVEGSVMANGVVKHFNQKTGYGFIEPSDGSEFVFVHRNAIENSGLEGLAEGQKVQYELVPGMDGKSAAENLVLLD